MAFLGFQFDDEIKSLKSELDKIRKKLADAEKEKRQAFCESAQHSRGNKLLTQDLENMRKSEEAARKSLEKQMRLNKKADAKIHGLEDCFRSQLSAAEAAAAEMKSKAEDLKEEFEEYKKSSLQVDSFNFLPCRADYETVHKRSKR